MKMRTHEFIAVRDHDVHFGRLGRDDFSLQRFLAQKHLTAIGFIDRYGGHFSENLQQNNENAFRNAKLTIIISVGF